MDTNFDRILTRSQRRQSIESSDTRDEDNHVNVGTPTKKSRVTKRLSSKLEDVPEIADPTPLKVTQEDNAVEINSPAKPLRGRRSLALSAIASPKRNVTDSPNRNLRRPIPHSPVDFEKTPSNEVSNSTGLDNIETQSQSKSLSPSKNTLIKKDILTAHNTFDSPKPKKNQKEKVGSLDVPHPRRSRRLSTELNIVQEDPVREEETDVITIKSASKPRRGKRLSTVPLQPTLTEEIEEPEIPNSEKLNKSIKEGELPKANCSIILTDICSDEKSGKDDLFDNAKLPSGNNISPNKRSSPRKLNENSICKESKQSKRMHKSMESNSVSVSKSASNNTKGGNKSMSALDKIESMETFNVNSKFSPTPVKEKSFKKQADNSGNLNSSHVKLAEKSFTKVSNTSQLSNVSLSDANLSKRSNRKCSFNLSENGTPKSNNNGTTADVMDVSCNSNNSSSVSNLSRSKRKSNSEDIIISTPKVPEDPNKIITATNVTHKSTPGNKSSSVLLDNSDLSLKDASNSSKKNYRKSAKDFFAQDTPKIDSESESKSKLSLSCTKTKKNIIDIATSTPNALNKVIVPKSLTHKSFTADVSKKNNSFGVNLSNPNNNGSRISEKEVKDSQLIEDLYMSVTEYAPTPAKNSDKSKTKEDKQVPDVSDENDSEDSIKLTFLDSASDAGSDYRSGDSMNDSEKEEIEDNEIVEKGESLRSELTESEHESHSKDSFICSDDSVDSGDLLSGTGDDLSSGDNELTQSKRSKEKYNLKQMKKQREASKELYEARHSSFNKSDSKVDKKYKKILHQPSNSESESSITETKNANFNDSRKSNSNIRDPLSTTICLDSSNTNTKIINCEVDSSDDSDVKMSPNKNESQNKTVQSTTICDDNNKSVHLQNKSVDKKPSDHESLSHENSESEDLEIIMSPYHKQLESLQEFKHSTNTTDDSSTSDEELPSLKPASAPLKSANESKVDMSLKSSPHKSTKLENSYKCNVTNTSPCIVNAEKSLQSINKTGNKDSSVSSESGFIKNMNISKQEKRNSLKKSSNDVSLKINSVTLQNSFNCEPTECLLNSSQKSSKNSKQNKILTPSKEDVIDFAAKSTFIEGSTDNQAKPVDSIMKRLSIKDNSPSHQQNQTSPRITNLANLLKSLPASSLELFSENNKNDQTARATTDFKVEQTEGKAGKKRKERNETLDSTWTNTAGDFEVVKKIKTQYPTRPITASDSGCTTSFSVVSLVKHPKQILKVDNQLESKFSNFKNEMLYGKRVKREQSTKLVKIQQKLMSKKKENFF